MKINGWDIARADARQWNVTPGFHAVSNESEWTRGSPVPVLFANETGFKRITIRLLIKREGGRQAILERCSRILSRMLGPAELELDGFQHRFYGILAKHSHKEDSMYRFHTLTLEFDCYEYGQEIRYPREPKQMTEEMTVWNPGNILTPAIIEITPETGIASVKLAGICRDARTGEDLPVTVRNLTKNTVVTLDGESGLFTEGEAQKAKDIDIWGFPALAPGENKISSDSTWIDVAVRFRPRYM